VPHSQRKVAYFCAAQWPTFAPPLTREGLVSFNKISIEPENIHSKRPAKLTIPSNTEKWAIYCKRVTDSHNGYHPRCGAVAILFSCSTESAPPSTSSIV